jgi:endonuclease YncB( thermonuclease family)
MSQCRHALKLTAFIGLTFGIAGHADAQSAVHCGVQTVPSGPIARIVDGRTFLLNDGREVRLAALEVPALARAREPDPNGYAAKDALAALLGKNTLVLKLAAAETPNDRYGRVPAYAYVIQNGTEISVQADLLAHGHARVAALVGDPGCAADLRSREEAARKAALGLWGDPYYGLKEAEHPADILARRGHFALVEGKVLSVRESGATIYVNFGRRWSEDFTVTILKRNERRFTAAGLVPKSLAGRRIRVRGWVEERGGPWIEATYPEQIEVAAGD